MSMLGFLVLNIEVAYYFLVLCHAHLLTFYQIYSKIIVNHEGAMPMFSIVSVSYQSRITGINVALSKQLVVLLRGAVIMFCPHQKC